MDDRRWMPPIDTDAYHGQIRTRDGRSFWVFPRLHRASGWYVELRADAIDGQLLERRWRPTYVAAGEATAERRTAIATACAEEVVAAPRAIEEPTEDRALVVAHGSRGLFSRGYTPQASVDGHVGNVCHMAWVPAGTVRVAWTSTFSALPDPICWVDAAVDAQHVLHLAKPSHLRPHQPGPFWPWHRCALRSLAFTDGVVTADRDVRQLLSRR